ncbi:unnamed protein product [Calypogeia fissa]
MPRTTKVELPGCPAFRAICCDSLGLIKVIEAEGEAGTPKVVDRWGEPDIRQGIRCISMSSDISPRLAVARKTNNVEILHPASGQLQSQLVVPSDPVDTPGRASRDASDAVCGLHLYSESSSWGPAVLTCTEYGDAALQRLSHEGQVSQSRTDEDQLIVKWNVSQTGSVLCMKVDGGEQHAVFGGKDVDVNVWDVAKKSKLWSGKTPHRDNLGLISPAWVTAVAFLSKEDHRKIVVGTGHHQVRLYDIGAQRRPVLAFDYGESPIKTVTEDPDGYSVYVGTGGGDLACFDMRTGKLLGGFKGKCAGSIRSVVRHPVLPIIASCGLDRYLRIHNTKTRQLLASLFLKQQLVSVAFDVEANISTKAAPLTSDTTGLENTTAEQGEEEKPAAKKRPKPVEKRMKLKKAKPRTSVSEHEDVMLEAKSRSLKRTDKERKASKVKGKRSKPEA